MTRVAFIGLGNMGRPMAVNLVRAGFDVAGFDLSPACREAAATEGVPVTASIEASVEGAGTVITMLPAGEHVRAVWTELVRLVPAGTLLVDCSTIDIESACAVHALAAERAAAPLDAPVSGGTAGAATATLTFMTGGEPDAFERARPILERMGHRVIHCGGPGAGQAAKACNNMILGVSMIAVCEAFVLAERLGLSHQAFFDVASTSSGQCWSLTTYCPVPGPVASSPANDGYKPGFSASLMLKDLRLAQSAALATGAAIPLGAQAAQLYALFDRLGGGTEDFSAIIRLLRETA